MKKILTLGVLFLGNSYASNLSDLTNSVQAAIQSAGVIQTQLEQDTQTYTNAISMMKTVEEQKFTDYKQKIDSLNASLISLSNDNAQYHQNLEGLLGAFQTVSSSNNQYSQWINGLTNNIYPADPTAFGEVAQNLQGQVTSLTSQNQSLLSQIQTLQEEIAKNNTHDVNNGGGTSDNNNGPIV